MLFINSLTNSFKYPYYNDITNPEEVYFLRGINLNQTRSRQIDDLPTTFVCSVG